MKVETWLKQATNELSTINIATARLDCLVLLEDVTGKDRAYLLAHPEHELATRTLHKLDKQVQRRMNHEPLAYIRGKSEFYGREFIVSPDTLQPRSESETMIDLLKTLLQHKSSISKDRPWKIVDVGTGSGALAITAKLELPDLEVYGTDISLEALKIAKKNAKTHQVDIKFFQGNLIEPIARQRPGFTYAEPESVLSLSSGARRIDNTSSEQRKGKTDYGPQTNSRVASSARKQAVGDTWILLANLPYVPDDHTINQAAMHEPKIAIFGGPDGLDLYREMFKQIATLSQKPIYILTESLPPQHNELANISKKHGFTQKSEEDFIQLFTLR